MTAYSYDENWWKSVKKNCLDVDFDLDARVKSTLEGFTTPPPSVSGRFAFFGTSNRSATSEQHKKELPGMDASEAPEAPKFNPNKS